MPSSTPSHGPTDFHCPDGQFIDYQHTTVCFLTRGYNEFEYLSEATLSVLGVPLNANEFSVTLTADGEAELNLIHATNLGVCIATTGTVTEDCFLTEPGSLSVTLT